MLGRAILPSDLLPFIQRVTTQTLRHTFHNDLKWIEQPLRIGACVSGGPDSMALAFLLSELRKQGTNIQYLSALIVDHKARPESTTEALQVQRNLTKIGVESTILTMQWPGHINPLALSDFESQARVKRYQLLARFALAHNIHHLFLGHHRDDQVETVLMRLIRNESISLRGLAGMAPEASLPCEFHTYGIHTARQDLLAPVGLTIPLPTQDLRLADRRKTFKMMSRLSIAGGLKLQRPLLPFSKPDLIATCQFNHVPYIIDPTNYDPTSCLRNAIRHLRAHHKLPRALNTASVLQLNIIAQQYLANVKEAGEAVLSTFQVQNLDLRSGVLRVRVPWREFSDSDELDACGYAISKLAETVTASVRVNHNTHVPSHITKKFYAFASGVEQTAASTAFTYDKVSFSPDKLQPETWILSRQPMTAAEIAENTMSFESAAHNQSRKLLWDNRFWVQIMNTHANVLNDLRIRPLREADMVTLFRRSADTPTDTDPELIKLRRQLRITAPGRVRFTLPVLTFKDELLALPTLNYYVPQVVDMMGMSRFGCNVSYNSFSLMDDTQLQPLTKPKDFKTPTSTSTPCDNPRRRFNQACLRSDAFKSIRARHMIARWKTT